LDIQHALENTVHPALLLELQETDFHHRGGLFPKFMAPSDAHGSRNHCGIVALSLRQLRDSLHVPFYTFSRKIIGHVEEAVDVPMEGRGDLAQCQRTVVV